MRKFSLIIVFVLFILFMGGCEDKDPQKTLDVIGTTFEHTTAAQTEDTEGTEDTPTADITTAVSTTVEKTPASTPTPSMTFDLSKINFSKENFPKLDGSTANIPMAELMLKKLLKLTDKEIKDGKWTEFSTTPYAYDNLINKEADLLLVYEADDLTKKRIENSGVKLEYYPIGRDALVFIVNEKNKIESLTETQIQDIYQGKITGWKSLNGQDIKMEAFQRPELSGSQALMRKLVMKDKEMTNAPSKYYPGEMNELLEILAEYNNSGGAIGYSVYYYTKNMYMKDGLKLIGVNGINPSNETIKDGTYPYTNDFYAVIRADEPQDSNTRKLLAWILSEQGKSVIEDSGYVAAN